jgi:carboxymethylenebutenolidase
MDQKIIDLYDGYIHGMMSRRDFIDRAATLVGSIAAAAALLPLLSSDYAKAETIPANDPRLANDKISFDTAKGKVTAYLSRPKAKGKRPAVIVIHQDKGVNPHIEDVTRRLGAEGFLALAPDMLAPYGGTPASEEEALNIFRTKLDRDDLTIPLATIAFLKTHPESTGKVGVVGFCFGGGVADRMALNSPDLGAAVAYYGTPPADYKSKVQNITAPLLLHYGALDTRVDATIPDWEAALKANNKKYQLYMYDGANHAFNDDTNGPRYNKAAADLAWSRTIPFLKENLGAPPNAA